MILSRKHITRHIGSGLAALLLVMLLAACGGNGGTSGTPTSTPATSTPTSAPVTPTTTLTLKTVTGNGFSIGYPQDWQVKSSANPVVFTNASGSDIFSVNVLPNPGATISADTLVSAT